MCTEAKSLMSLRLDSDGVLNPSGVRFGSGEIYTVLEMFSGSIDDSLCIGQRRPQDKDERVLLFLKMRPGYKFTPKLVADIKTSIRKGLSARHVPSYIFEVSDIPVRLSRSCHATYYQVNVYICPSTL
jgi:acetoacetyl-CoA synthetase